MNWYKKAQYGRDSAYTDVGHFFRRHNDQKGNALQLPKGYKEILYFIDKNWQIHTHTYSHKDYNTRLKVTHYEIWGHEIDKGMVAGRIVLGPGQRLGSIRIVNGELMYINNPLIDKKRDYVMKKGRAMVERAFDIYDLREF